MDQHYLSAVKQSLRTIPSRRELLRGIAAGLGIGALGLADDAEAKNRKRKKGKGKNRKNRRQNENRVPPVDPSPPTPPTCTPECNAIDPCGPDGCGGSCGTCGTNETCENGTCICVPQCAPSNACGPNGCGGSCGTCPGATCQGTTLTTHVCNGVTCTPIATSCAAGQVCFQNACCTKEPQPSCHKQAVSDGCGGVYQPNCGQQQHCCDGPDGELICRSLPCA